MHVALYMFLYCKRLKKTAANVVIGSIMGGRKKRLGRIPKYMEKKRQATGVNKQGRPRKFWQVKVSLHECIGPLFYSNSF